MAGTAKKNTKKQPQRRSSAPKRSKAPEKNGNLVGEVAGIVLIALGILLAAFLYFSYDAPLAKWSRVGILGLFGVLGYALPVIVLAGGVLLIANMDLKQKNTALAVMFLWLLIAFIDLCSVRIYAASAIGIFPYLGQCFTNGNAAAGGGILGGLLSWPAERLLGKVGGLILLGAGMAVCAMLITHFSIRGAATALGGRIRNASASAAAARSEREARRVRSISEQAEDAEALYDEHFAEPAYDYEAERTQAERQRRAQQKQELRERKAQEALRRKEQQAEKQRLAEQRELEREQEHKRLAREDARKGDLHILRKEYGSKEAFPEAEQQAQIEMYPSDGGTGVGFKKAKLKPRRGVAKRSKVNHEILTPKAKVRDPFQQQLAEQYYDDAGLPRKTEEDALKSRPIKSYASAFQDGEYVGYAAERQLQPEQDTQQMPETALDRQAEQPVYEPEQQEDTMPYVAEVLEAEEPDAEEAPEELPEPPLPPPAPPKQEYLLPKRLDLLDDSPKSNYGDRMRNQNLQKALILEQALKSFNIDVKINNIVTGPTVTRYELLPAPGVKASSILNLSNDIALNLAAPSVRIEAPIPGKAAIGIEVPNAEVESVKLRELLEDPEYKNAKSSLFFALGKDITGKFIFGDLAKMPHLLVAGTTGSGKSVCMNTIIMSILYRSSPEEVNLLIVDPKVVEMKRFNGIPHMKTAVVTDPKKATSMLNWVVNEMLKRYKDFADCNVKEIDSYNAMRKEQGEKILPKLVIIIDELADLMMASKNEVEEAICRIAQLGRAAGIHLVVATQSPRKEVVTGMIKTNISSRIALTVSSGIDSRIILDMNGAEKLLGRGDMLFMPIGSSKPVRLQGCYLSEAEINRVIQFLKDSAHESSEDKDLEKQLTEGVPANNGAAGSEPDASADGFDDDLIPAAIELGLEYEQLSSSMLMRRLKVGYARAARLVDQLELKEIVSPADGNKPRQLLITREEYLKMFGKEEN